LLFDQTVRPCAKAIASKYTHSHAIELRRPEKIEGLANRIVHNRFWHGNERL